MDPVVVEHEVELAPRIAPGDELEELEELLVAVAGIGPPVTSPVAKSRAAKRVAVR